MLLCFSFFFFLFFQCFFGTGPVPDRACFEEKHRKINTISQKNAVCSVFEIKNTYNGNGTKENGKMGKTKNEKHGQIIQRPFLHA